MWLVKVESNRLAIWFDAPHLETFIENERSPWMSTMATGHQRSSRNAYANNHRNWPCERQLRFTGANRV